MDKAATKSYWEVDDYGELTKLLRSHGLRIRFLKRGRDYHVYDFSGLEMHVYRNIRPLLRYRIDCEIARALNRWNGKKRLLWLSIGVNAPIEALMTGEAAIFSHNGHIHAVTYDTSMAGFARLVVLVSRTLSGALERAPSAAPAVRGRPTSATI